MTRVLLSAAHPYGERAAQFRPYSHPDIDLAASSVIETVLRRAGWTLVFGGHPSITPLVLSIASFLGDKCKGDIELVQSRFFAEQYTDEMRTLAARREVTPIETPEAPASPPLTTRDESLRLMRARLLQGPFDAAFFVGGMEGVRDECLVVARQHPRAMLYAFTAPGGAAARLADGDHMSEEPPQVRRIDGSGYIVTTQHAASLIVPS